MLPGKKFFPQKLHFHLLIEDFWVFIKSIFQTIYVKDYKCWCNAWGMSGYKIKIWHSHNAQHFNNIPTNQSIITKVSIVCSYTHVGTRKGQPDENLLTLMVINLERVLNCSTMKYIKKWFWYACSCDKEKESW